MQESVIRILSEIKNDPGLLETLNGDSDIINGVGLDSLQMINFVLRVEDEFEIEIDFDEFDLCHLNSIDSFVSYISKEKD